MGNDLKKIKFSLFNGYHMNRGFIADKTYRAEDIEKELFKPGDFEFCIFQACIFSKHDLSGFSFSECEFFDCDFSNTPLNDTTIREGNFQNCKLLGVRFDRCNKFLLSLNFQGCDLSFSSFYNLKLKKIVFKKCKLEQVDFSEADLQQAKFENCNLTAAGFENTNLERADFRSAENFSIDPEKNKIKNAKFSLNNLSGLLDKYHLEIR